MLYGVTTLQLYMYFVTYPNDAQRFKILAVITWILDSASMGLVASAMYGYLVTDMGNPLARIRVNRALDLDPALMGVLAFLTHGFLGTRVWLVCKKNMFLAGILAVLSCTALSLSIASSVIAFRFELWTERHAMKSLGLAGTALVVVLDTLIATILCVYLLMQRATGKNVRRIVRGVCVLAINTGLTSSLLSILNIVTFFAFPNSMIFLATNFVFTKVYANCLLANLNARESLRGQGYLDEGTITLNLSVLRRDADESVDPIAIEQIYDATHVSPKSQDSHFAFPKRDNNCSRPSSIL